MTLAQYLADKSIPDADFALRIGVSRQSLWRYRTGERRPDWSVIQRIHAATDGSVTADDFMVHPARAAS